MIAAAGGGFTTPRGQPNARAEGVNQRAGGVQPPANRTLSSSHRADSADYSEDNAINSSFIAIISGTKLGAWG